MKKDNTLRDYKWCIERKPYKFILEKLSEKPRSASELIKEINKDINNFKIIRKGGENINLSLQGFMKDYIKKLQKVYLIIKLSRNKKNILFLKNFYNREWDYRDYRSDVRKEKKEEDYTNKILKIENKPRAYYFYTPETAKANLIFKTLLNKFEDFIDKKEQVKTNLKDFLELMAKYEILTRKEEKDLGFAHRHKIINGKIVCLPSDTPSFLEIHTKFKNFDKTINNFLKEIGIGDSEGNAKILGSILNRFESLFELLDQDINLTKILDKISKEINQSL